KRGTPRGGTRKVTVHSHLGEKWPGGLQRGVQQDACQRQRYQAAVRAQVSQQALHQPRVIGFTEYLFLVHESGPRSKSKVQGSRIGPVSTLDAGPIPFPVLPPAVAFGTARNSNRRETAARRACRSRRSPRLPARR